MNTTIPFFYTIIKLKQFQEISIYDMLLSNECAKHQDIMQTGAYWLNHINIVDNIFRAHLWGEQHNYRSTESDDFPDLTSLRTRAIASNKWLLAYASTLTLHTSSQRVAFTFTDGTRGDMTRAEILLHLQTHSQGHLSFIASQLAEKDLSIPPILLTTMSGMTDYTRS